MSFANISLEAAKVQRSSAAGLMSLLRNLGRVYMEASKYNSREAIRLLEEIPDHHGKSSWALALRGKCHFELAEYKEAAELFRILRDQDPLRLEMMEYYSTALWHIQVNNQENNQILLIVKNRPHWGGGIPYIYHVHIHPCTILKSCFFAFTFTVLMKLIFEMFR